ncbi:BrnT family toxin [Parvularcula maris]|uniref:BrnT family toxin n=1 Tax=Parvularcula maris TaxID=2965077 RepID=A0A9X2L921_9PROT|nr:BrnT family toxin [Parvularcula maris]MCQ8185348.1 BrnT family toxin [Parvularcula maris]
MIQLTWNEEKRAKVYEERGVDLLAAAEMFLYPERTVGRRDDRQDYGEERFNAVGPSSEGVWYHLTYTRRGEVIHLITAWRLNDESRRKYQKRYAGRAEGDAEEGRDPS